MADPRPPLWELMRAADSSCASDFISPEAKAIITVRDWLVPEEHATPMLPAGYEETRVRWVERQRLRALLTPEADRAERGETISPSEADCLTRLR